MASLVGCLSVSIFISSLEIRVWPLTLEYALLLRVSVYLSSEARKNPRGCKVERPSHGDSNKEKGFHLMHFNSASLIFSKLRMLHFVWARKNPIDFKVKRSEFDITLTQTGHT